MNVFMLWHIHDLTDDFGTHDEEKLIGIFSSEAKAQEAINFLKSREGFRDFPLSCFEIHKTKVDQVNWIDGFSAVHYKP